MSKIKKTARVIITFQCQRSCRGCCNTYSHIMKHAVCIDNITALCGHDTICITGGEPLLEPDRTLEIIAEIRRQYPQTIVYLYSALYIERMAEIIKAVDGIHYTLHEGATEQDIDGFQHFQELISGECCNKSFRLYIDPRVKHSVLVQPHLWRRIEVKPWMSEEDLIAVQPNGLPINETLFILKNKES